MPAYNFVDLLPRPWSTHTPRVEGFSPTIRGKVERVSKSRTIGWRYTVYVDDNPMLRGHCGTKSIAESHLSNSLQAYTEAHYISK